MEGVKLTQHVHVLVIQLFKNAIMIGEGSKQRKTSCTKTLLSFFSILAPLGIAFEITDPLALKGPILPFPPSTSSA